MKMNPDDTTALVAAVVEVPIASLHHSPLMHMDICRVSLDGCFHAPLRGKYLQNTHRLWFLVLEVNECNADVVNVCAGVEQADTDVLKRALLHNSPTTQKIKHVRVGKVSHLN